MWAQSVDHHLARVHCRCAHDGTMQLSGEADERIILPRAARAARAKHERQRPPLAWTRGKHAREHRQTMRIGVSHRQRLHHPCSGRPTHFLFPNVGWRLLVKRRCLAVRGGGWWRQWRLEKRPHGVRRPAEGWRPVAGRDRLSVGASYSRATGSVRVRALALVLALYSLVDRPAHRNDRTNGARRRARRRTRIRRRRAWARVLGTLCLQVGARSWRVIGPPPRAEPLLRQPEARARGRAWPRRERRRVRARSWRSGPRLGAV